VAWPWSRPTALGQAGLGPEPEPGWLASFPTHTLGPETATGRLVYTGRPSVIKENRFLFFFYFKHKNTLENVCVFI
jgi:hypothetical protein